MQRKNFAFKFEWQQAIAHLDPIVRLEIYEQTIRYAETGQTCFSTDVAATAFNSYILPDFERRRKAAEYRARAKARRQAEAEVPASNNSDKSDKSDKSNNPNSSILPTHTTAPLTPNRRERRLMLAEEKRLNKKRQRNRLRKGSGEDGAQKKILPPGEQNPHSFFDSFFTCF